MPYLKASFFLKVTKILKFWTLVDKGKLTMAYDFSYQTSLLKFCQISRFVIWPEVTVVSGFYLNSEPWRMNHDDIYLEWRHFDCFFTWVILWLIMTHQDVIVAWKPDFRLINRWFLGIQVSYVDETWISVFSIERPFEQAIISKFQEKIIFGEKVLKNADLWLFSIVFSNFRALRVTFRKFF